MEKLQATFDKLLLSQILTFALIAQQLGIIPSLGLEFQTRGRTFRFILLFKLPVASDWNSAD